MSSIDWAENFYSDKAIKKQENQLKKALKFSPDDCVVISNCGDFYYENGKYDEALGYFLRSAGIDDKNAENYYKTAKCYIAKNLLNDAVMYLEKAVSLDENEPKYLSELARIYYKKNNFEKAKEAFEKIITLVPESAWAYSNLGNIYFYHLDDIDTAYKYYTFAVDVDLDYDWGLYNLASVKVLFKEFEEAIVLYRRACEISPNNELFQFALAHTYYRAGLVDDAINLFKKLLEKSENNEDVLFCLGKMYFKDKKDNVRAKKYFEKAKLLDENNAEIYYYLAQILFFDFDKKNAIINISRALELDSDNDKYKAMRNRIDDME